MGDTAITIQVVGSSLSTHQVLQALRAHFPQKSFRRGYHDNTIVSEDSKLLLDETSSKCDTDELQMALQCLKVCQGQYTELENEVESYKKKLDSQRSKLHSMLWKNCQPYHPELFGIPLVKNDIDVETETRIGDYSIAAYISSGQFSTVKSCRKDGTSTNFALKIIEKNRIESFGTLQRLSTEIHVLRKLKSRYIIGCIDVIHTDRNIYVVMEDGGPDLFQFLEHFPSGVPESIAKRIAYQLLSALQFFHAHYYCHRDIKPEVQIRPLLYHPTHH
jgi:hypothetical protein